MASKLLPFRPMFGAAGKSFTNKGSLRRLHYSRMRHAAQNFTMPAMSPTMTEGNIATWKVEEGQSFTAGDVLLEVETDKAQMDVEAQDDGIVAKIMSPGGSKGIKVGTRIAVLAGPDDDLSTLEIPAESHARPAETPKEPPTERASPPKQESSPQAESVVESSRGPTSNSGGKTPQQINPSANSRRTYPLYPSVTQLFHEHGIDISKAADIPATGPNGRLLKGDVLAFLGTIDPSYPQKQSDRLAKLSHLDLSNINRTVARQPTLPPAIGKTTTAPQASDLKTQISLPISLSAVLEAQKRVKGALGVDIPLETFIARAVEVSNSALPRPDIPPTADELFDQILGLDKVRTKQWQGHFKPRISNLPAQPGTSRTLNKRNPDVIDALVGSPRANVALNRISALDSGALGAKVFSLEVARPDAERGKIFLERVKTILQKEPGRLVL